MHDPPGARPHRPTPLPPTTCRRRQWPRVPARCTRAAVSRAQLNCASELLDKRHWPKGFGDRVCIRCPAPGWCGPMPSCRRRPTASPRCWCSDMGLVPGNRVLLRAPNNPMLAACWFAVIKAGGIAVGTMPLLRAKELGHHRQGAGHARAVRRRPGRGAGAGRRRTHPVLRRCGTSWHVLDGAEPACGLEAVPARQSRALRQRAHRGRRHRLLAFTSGTTGKPKATMHFHRDVMAGVRGWPTHVLRPEADDVFIGSPPLAFTFGLGGLLLFPWRWARPRCCWRRPPAAAAGRHPGLRRHHAVHRAHLLPALALLAASGLRRTALRKCVSAGEALPAATRALWKEATGIEMIDGIGATELLHIFISADEATPPRRHRPAVPGYRARWSTTGQEVPPAPWASWRCRAPPAAATWTTRARPTYVQGGWNLTGDAYLHGRRRLLLLPGAHRRHDHLGRLQHRRPRGGRRCCCTRPWPSAR
jgi:2-aminobenzoate-CoA ligase